MNTKESQIKNFILACYIPVFVLGAIFFVFIRKGDLVLYFNEIHTPFFDWFFKYYTYVGHGLLFIVPFVWYLFIKFRYSAILLTTFAIQGILSPLMKRVPLWNSVRPKLYFENSDVVLNFVEGVRVHSQNSLPSGHTTTAFSFFVILSLLSGSRTWTIIGLLLAVIGGLSRVYLIQHFYIDIYFGGILGTVSAFLAWYLLKNKENEFLERKIRLN